VCLETTVAERAFASVIKHEIIAAESIGEQEAIIMATDLVVEEYAPSFDEGEEQEPMADGISGIIGARLTHYLLGHVEDNKLGWVFNSDTDFELPGVGKRRPDVAFCSFETLPRVPRSAIPTLPDLAVEITSSRDEIDPTDKKVNEYRRLKVKLVWVIKPEGKVIEVYRNGQATDLLDINKTLDGDPVIPGFKLPVSKLFDFLTAE
jgi:Uma2 family endonuclease